MSPSLLPVTSSIAINSFVIVAVFAFNLSGTALLLTIGGLVIVNAFIMIGVYVVGSRLSKRQAVSKK